MISDLRYALRRLLHAPGFSVIAALTLALGIGANSALFTLVNSVMRQSLPGVHDDGRLVWVAGLEGRRARPTNFSYPDFVDFRDGSGTFEQLAAYGGASVSLAGPGGAPERVKGMLVTGNYFSTLGTRLAAGRGFVPADDSVTGASPVTVISHRLWQRRFGGNPAAVGQLLTFNGHSYTIIGIAPEAFNGAEVSEPIDVWVPIAMQPVMMPNMPDMLARRGTWWLRSIGRLNAGVSVDDALTRVRTVAAQHAKAFPDHEGVSATVLPLTGGIYPTDRGEGIPIILLGFAVTGLVLLITCSNVANLMLARALARGREIGVRMALGASRGRLVRQLVSESVLLSILGGGAGLLLSFWLTELLLRSLGPDVIIPVRPDWVVLAFTAALAIGTGIVFGLAPALNATRHAVVPALKEDVVGRGVRRSRLQASLVISQISLSLVLLVTAGLFIRSLQKAAQVDVGFDARGNVIALSFDLGIQGYDSIRSREFYSRIEARAQQLPGVQSVAIANQIPLSGRLIGTELTVEGRTEPVESRRDNDGGRTVNFSQVSPNYFRTMGIPLLRGRGFTPADARQEAGVVVVNRALADRTWPGENPLGRRISLSGTRGPFLEVIGVAKTGKYSDLTERSRMYAYLPIGHDDVAIDQHLLVRVDGDAAKLGQALRSAIGDLDPQLPVFGVMTIADYLDARGRGLQIGSVVLALFGALALVLAGIGLYGVMAQSVTQRTREVGVRVAVGAKTSDVIRLFVGAGTRLAVTGVAIGVVLAAGMARLLSAMIFGVGAGDLTTFISVSLLLLGVTMLATLIPARRAARLDPMSALRAE